MELEFDRWKDARNIGEHGVSLERFVEMDLSTALAVEDGRFDYGERRVRVFGTIGNRLHVAVVTYRGEKVRVISLRRANRREEQGYEKEAKPS